MLNLNQTRRNALGLIAGGVAALAAVPALAQDFPGGRGIELVAGYGPGGGHDTLLRTMAKILQEEGIIEEPLSVVNKEGGSSAVAMGYLNGHAGDGHYLMSVTSSHVTTPLTSNVGIDYTDFTPIARLGIDPELLLVSSKGPYQSIDDLKAAGKMLNVGGTATGSIEHIVAIEFGEQAGVEVNFIPFQGDGDVVSALLSGQVDFTIGNPGSARDFIEAGNFKALAVSTDERIELMPEVPTFKEQDLDITMSLFRGITAPGDIDDETRDWLIGKMKELSENAKWKEVYLDPNGVVPGFLPGDDFAEYLGQTQGIYKDALTKLGLLK
ncbi:tripartite tricarboxylate transporter substrate binding protein [Oceaniovalibus sp. ACAM 378]|jgi:putative tricarboxylic transport membrane protein|uniref:Bug family tripartite tricarboxylate transporter substrate binding protein n=1 Tax=Oceaniovalibus sp. ACAM 378 TaxID=2599923 RepID=UPI0011DC2444|nr:tripartite tricarboxylate transporter substrate binding protein [Oceaniovalibus sp. ACAM 378]TYB84631.1 tripartite tricarboxylate transporter substrate binding protein [Oceaniovalibus sp. ACAM 378]